MNSCIMSGKIVPSSFEPLPCGFLGSLVIPPCVCILMWIWDIAWHTDIHASKGPSLPFMFYDVSVCYHYVDPTLSTRGHQYQLMTAGSISMSCPGVRYLYLSKLLCYLIVILMNDAMNYNYWLFVFSWPAFWHRRLAGVKRYDGRHNSINLKSE